MQPERLERLETMIRENRIIRYEWSEEDEQGREVACLLVALSPEVGRAESAEACPAEVMPAWLAHLTPWMDDGGSDAEWPRVVSRYAACAARWSALDEAAWRRVEIAVRRAAVVEAMRHTTNEEVLGACRGVLAWLDQDMPEASRAAVILVARVAEDAVAEGAAQSAAQSAAAAATGAAMQAAAVRLAAADARLAAESTAKSTSQSAAALASEAADRITDAVLSALEKECGL